MTQERRQLPGGDRRRHKRGGRRITDLCTHDVPHITPRQLADYLHVDRRTVLKWIDSGILVAYRFDTALRIKTTDARLFVERQRLSAQNDHPDT